MTREEKIEELRAQVMDIIDGNYIEEGEELLRQLIVKCHMNGFIEGKKQSGIFPDK